jgi:hypothetical protein
MTYYIAMGLRVIKKKQLAKFGDIYATEKQVDGLALIKKFWTTTEHYSKFNDLDFQIKSSMTSIAHQSESEPTSSHFTQDNSSIKDPAST